VVEGDGQSRQQIRGKGTQPFLVVSARARTLQPRNGPKPPNILPILIAQPNLISRVGPSLREFLDEKIQSVSGASNLLSHIRETE
jgi:hypothetical protein